MTNDLLQCALGVHRYDGKITENRFRCSICKRADHFKGLFGYEYWREFDEKGVVVHFRDSTGFESWTEYDEKGRETHYRSSDGDEFSYNESQYD